MALRALNLCDGYGGFSLALADLGVRTVCRVERDSYAAAVLVERMEQARLDSCPIWDDLTTFDGAAWRGRVDLITAGFPCQPFSAAGQRGGLDDDRWLWPSIAGIIAAVRPGFVFLENVPGVVGAGLPAVLHDLANLGFDAEWGLLSAAAVGAPHKRERFWLVAHSASAGRGERLDGSFIGRLPANTQAGSHDNVADAQSGRLEGRRVPDRLVGPAMGVADRNRSRTGSEDVADASSVDCQPWNRPRPHQRQSPRTDVQVSSDGMGWPPRPDDHDGWAEWIAQGGPQPVLRRQSNGPPTGLADALHLGGNGLVPAAAREAFRQLCQRNGWDMT